ncbi:hypothetical protein GMST_16470 [Geomonas silvestris]|uniref:Uncharacterized protein n=1 Tax=Geomonas silvestris TaxID=2740184 RepID=A0A6V8MH85_9BACT|nr:DUF6178 family protein [Geomonas silvestris]GFO59322.1 hypothetical protein GMST_16470 [Geomonas silvestris]
MAKAGKDVAVTEELSPKTFAALSLAEKNGYLKTVSAKRRLDLMLGDPDAKRLIQALAPQELFWMVKEIGETDALELLQLSSAEQRIFIFDMELWNGFDFSEEQACHWLAYFMEGGEPSIHALLKQLDFGFLHLLLSRELTVGGGIGDLADDEERLGDYDHTFDNTFMLSFKNPKHSQVIGNFVGMIYRLDTPLYVALMEGIKGDVDLELEEQCQRFRTGRLEDLGFPPLDEALSIYARINPGSFQLEGGKEAQVSAGECPGLVPIAAEDTLLFRALARAGSETLWQELNYLVNSALVAEGSSLGDQEAMLGILHRVCGYLNIALEQLCGADGVKAADVLRSETLKHLFQLGFSIVMELKFAAQQTETADYASGKLLAGLKSKRPRFYRGLDADGIDGYREFATLDDVKKVASLLAQLAG